MFFIMLTNVQTPTIMQKMCAQSSFMLFSTINLFYRLGQIASRRGTVYVPVSLGKPMAICTFSRGYLVPPLDLCMEGDFPKRVMKYT